MIEEGSLMPRHNGGSSLSSTSPVNQHRVPISQRRRENAIAFSMLPLTHLNATYKCYDSSRETSLTGRFDITGDRMWKAPHASFHCRNCGSRKRLTLGVPDNRGVPAVETVAAAATRP
ncbi:hypothetical protein DMN91_004185 [Ooceraea biroi]|uniref:Uncharacterized protein n=1 Tax=Ooceraea biroi TaxID=2015173 RepID=A0A3L8DU57_OOCBI|nr:hypothetical protein DMN91_004185 [Ooceraea biroi]